ncbi:MFS transporter [Chloroflexota bacterium]
MKNQSEDLNGYPLTGGIQEGVDDAAGVRPVIISRRQRTFSSFSNPVFRLYYGSTLGHMAAMNMQMITRSLLVYRLTGSPAILGAISLAHASPMIFLSIFGGVIADRLHKKHVLIMGQSASAVVAICVAFALVLGYLSIDKPGSWWILVVASILQGTIMALMMPSRQTIVAEIVDQGQLMNAVALNSLGMNTCRFMAPALAGVLIDAFGFEAIYFTMTGLYLTAVLFISAIPLTGTKSIRSENTFKNLKDGIQYVRHETTILLILALTLFAVVLSMPYRAMMPIFADDVLKVGATGMGVLISVSGIGAIGGALFLASRPNKKRGAMLLVSGIILGLALVMFSFSRTWYLSLALMLLVGLGQSGRMTLGNTLLQHYVKSEYRGRVMSLYVMEFGLTSLGVFVAGIMAESIGVQWSVGGLAMLFILGFALALVFLPRIRNLD